MKIKYKNVENWLELKAQPVMDFPFFRCTAANFVLMFYLFVQIILFINELYFSFHLRIVK